MYKFAPANRQESIVYGAARPKYTQKAVKKWIYFMQEQEIKRICCLLNREHIDRYQTDLLKIYQVNFGRENILWKPLQDFQIPQSTILINSILPFLISAQKQQEKVVVHCSGGIGRTGIVLATWLVSYRGLSNQDAISAVKQNKRNPHEAIIAALIKCQNPNLAKQKLEALLNDCRHAFKQS